MRSTGRALLGTAIAVVLAAACGAPAARASAPPPKASFSLSITSSASLQELVTARFRGTVSQVPASTAVQVQRRTAAGTWRTVATAKTGRAGAFAGTFTPTGLGPTAFRAHVPAAASRAAADSSTRTATVPKFFFLDRIPLAHPADGITFGPITDTAGDALPHGMVMDGAAVKTGNVVATWTIGGHCSKVIAFVSVPKSEDGLVAIAAVGDGKTVFSFNTVASGGFNAIQTPVSGAQQLTIATDIRKPGTGGQKVNWFSAAVLCTVDPRSL